MGVTRKSSADFRPVRVEDTAEFNYADYDLSESGDEFDRRVPIGQQVHAMRLRSAKNKKCGLISKRYCEDLDTDGVNLKRNMGSRKWRRVEHARMLLTFTDLEDICEDGSDICSQPVTAFDKLFADRENMKIWNEFVEKDEIEQRKILNSKSTAQKCTSKPTTSIWTSPILKRTPIKKVEDHDVDQRRHHPAYTGKACFDRLDKKSKEVLLGRKVNWALVDHLETELRAVFTRSIPGTPQLDETVFVAHYPASTDRLLAHIVSQYLWLFSQSTTEPVTGDRITEIRNLRPFFIPPHITLIQYLEQFVLNKKLDFIPYSERDEDFSDSSFIDPNEIADEINQLVISNDTSDDEWVNTA